jgi:hypothetical protein
MKSVIRALFAIAALYDGGLGLLFLIGGGAVFARYHVTPPNHWGYVQFPALLLIIFGLMFAAVAWKPGENRNLIPYGMLLKASYCSIVFYYWFTSGIPSLWKPFAVIDLVFLILFVLSYLVLCKECQSEPG